MMSPELNAELTMKYSFKNYIILGVVFLLSVVVSIYLPTSEILHEISTFPAIMALIGVIYQIFRDQSVFEKQLLIQQTQNQFTIGAASHMAKAAFDNHVAFSEEYVKETYSCLETLFREAPSEMASEHARNLYKIRCKFSIWLTNDIDKHLEKFESTLRKIGAGAYILKKEGAGALKQDSIKEVYKLFADVLGREYLGADNWQGESLTEDLAIENIVRGLRSLLGMEELTRIRREILLKALPCEIC